MIKGPLQVIDADSSKFQESMANKAAIVVDEMLDKAISEEGIKSKTMAVNAYVKYKQSIQDDPVYLMNKLAGMDEKKL